jgi:hypothetical protein
MLAKLGCRYGARFRQKFTPEDAIGSNACWLEARACVRPIAILSGVHHLLPCGTTVNCVQTLKDRNCDSNVAALDAAVEKLVTEKNAVENELAKDDTKLAQVHGDRVFAKGTLESWQAKLQTRDGERSALSAALESQRQKQVMLSADEARARAELAEEEDRMVELLSEEAQIEAIITSKEVELYGAHFSTEIYTRGCALYIGFHALTQTTALLRLKHCHACDQWHSSRVSTASYRYPRKICPNTAGHPSWPTLASPRTRETLPSNRQQEGPWKSKSCSEHIKRMGGCTPHREGRYRRGIS